MATGHLNPGYGNPVTRLRRAKSALAHDPDKFRRLLELTNVDQESLDQIRREARGVWVQPDRSVTSYCHFFSEKTLDGRMKPRPASATRKNNPHPPLIFLTNRLHYIQGYHNADTTQGKEAYRIDAAVQGDERFARDRIREKYIGRPRTAAVNQYQDKYGLREHMNPIEAQAGEAWLKEADDKDKDQVYEAIREQQDVLDKHITMRTPSPGNVKPYRPLVPSLHRWMKAACPQELSNLGSCRSIQDNHRENFPELTRPSSRSPHTRYVGEMRARDLEAKRNTRHTPITKRGDFLMHPEWPPTFEHHRLS